ncbi:peptidoglycan DD-metalloendopeptidase family protein [Candidatus Gottesmanbacteria bacterium]|nr:peptidoglycan DD-metalloendopeptidase family protein [Candidatus Gottesmanbacteria bacterium]
MKKIFSYLFDDIRAWASGWLLYIERQVTSFAYWFETNKNNLVDILMARRGTYQRPFLYFSLSILFVVGVIGGPILAKTYPGGLPAALAEFTPPSAVVSSLDLTNYGVQTQISDKPRDQVITYTVINGDTLAKIADKFGVSVDTIRWANDIRGDSLSIGDKLQIPPVTGIVHKVTEGETIYSIAKKYKTDPQKIVNFPFNDFADLDTFALNVGQILVVPDGVQPEAPAIIIPAPPVFAGGTGQFLWPVGGIITQYPIWYHMALDIANPGLPGIAAAGDGVVSLVEYLRYGYGQHIVIDHGNGFSTLYGHMSEIYVRVGDRVARGQIIGKMGSTGRSTGPHLHFEVRINGVPVDPRPYLK